jgi:CRP/FNR family transcriptional regulator, cyclic AMP receptor protein
MISPETLRRFSCFSPVPEASLKAVAMISREESVPSGVTIFNERDPADALRIITDGKVDIRYTLRVGELRSIDTLVAGDILGWSALVEPYRMTGTATACTDTRLIVVEAKPLRALCEQDPLLGYRLMSEAVKLLSDRLDGARVQLATAFTANASSAAFRVHLAREGSNA